MKCRKSLENFKANCLSQDDSAGLVIVENIQMHLEKQKIYYKNYNLVKIPDFFFMKNKIQWYIIYI